MAGVYRDLLAGGEAIDPAQMAHAGELVRDAVVALPRNPTERLLLQSVLVQLPIIA